MASHEANATSSRFSMPATPPSASVASEPAPALVATVEDASATRDATEDATPLDAPGDAIADVSSSEPEVDAANVSAADSDDEVDLKKLRIEAERALNRSKWDAAIPLCEKGLKADPEDARWYLFLGTALQGKGQPSQAATVFKQCVEKATRGAKHECRMFAR